MPFLANIFHRLHAPGGYDIAWGFTIFLSKISVVNIGFNVPVVFRKAPAETWVWHKQDMLHSLFVEGGDKLVDGVVFQKGCRALCCLGSDPIARFKDIIKPAVAGIIDKDIIDFFHLFGHKVTELLHDVILGRISVLQKDDVLLLEEILLFEQFGNRIGVVDSRLQVRVILVFTDPNYHSIVGAGGKFFVQCGSVELGADLDATLRTYISTE